MQPVNWWANERAQYTKEGSLKALIHREEDEELPRKYSSRRKTKGKKKSLDAIEEEDEDELEEWEKEEGVLTGNYQDFDPETDTTADAIVDGGMFLSLFSFTVQH
jgi:centromere protein C